MERIRPRLLRIDGGVIRGEFPLADGAVAGRAPTAAVRLLDQSVSREHARFYRAGVDWWIRDLDSSNGSYVNGAAIDAEILKPGDEIRLGQVVLVFSDPGAEPRETVVLTGETAPPRTAEVPVADADPLDLDALVDRILNRAVRVGRCATAGLVLRTPGAAGFGYREARDADGREPEHFEIDAALVAEVVDAGVPRRKGRALVIPLQAGDRAFGALVAVHGAGAEFGQEAVGKLEDLCRAAGESLLAALRISRSEAQLEAARAGSEAAQTIIGRSACIRRVLDMADRVAPTDATVLIEGETGTGKELVARRIHEGSPRAAGPFVAVNCAAVAPTLFESELFGHERGAFTGAVRAKAGRLELASGGTLFLDEVAELPREAQGKLLRALQERVVERVGGTKSVSIDARFLAATNRDLRAEVRAGRFRRDLYYRLGVVTIRLPALHERTDDIPLLAEHYLHVFARRLGKEIEAFDAKAIEALEGYRWPGNVRELANVIHRAVVLAEGQGIRARDLGMDILDGGSDDDGESEAYDLETMEKRAVARALRRTGWKKGEAARLLGVSFPTLNKKIRKYGLEPGA